MVIRPAECEEQIEDCFYELLKALENYEFDLLPTRHNARVIAEQHLIPAWERGEPILMAFEGEKIIGATFTTYASENLQFRARFAYGYGTWVHPEHRKQGVAKALLEHVRAMLREAGIKRQEGMALVNNDASICAFQKMGFVPHGIVLRSDV